MKGGAFMRMLVVLSSTAFAVSAGAREMKPLDADERAALGFLDFVTGPLSSAERREWWNVGGRQFGLFAKRYHLAFAGYAAAALGLRGNCEERALVVRILKNCVEGMLQRDVWAYTQSKNYWGGQPWAPDPCYRENIMYTGHLLQLLALYERFSGDRTYWEKGFDFVWSEEKSVHYDVQKLIDVTVAQMRENSFCGVTCEPGLLFFPCNNHPQVAFRLFAKMGHGDWSADSRRWERWALDHFQSPLFGGGALNLVYHVKFGLFYPRGQSALDGWSLLWYEAWATDRTTAIDLWRKAAAKIDWEKLDGVSDVKEGNGCCDPQAVSPSVAAVFLAAAARACDDVATAERLEKAVDAKYLVRRDGRLYLELNREWRIGATAHRILSLAQSNGSRLRDLW